MKNSKARGFTIVELLIVIVVIGILAVITIVAYNGIQQRANNNKTTTALSAWIKAMKLYKVDKGRWPSNPVAVCLGEGYKFGPDGTATSGQAQCRQDGATGGFLESTTFNNLMKDYVGGSFPTPAMVTAKAGDTQWRRGLSYYYGGGAGTVVYIDVAYAGVLSICPSVDGITTSGTNWGGNTYCNYVIGSTTDT